MQGGRPNTALKLTGAPVRAAVLDHRGVRELIFCCFSPGDLGVHEELLGAAPA